MCTIRYVDIPLPYHYKKYHYYRGKLKIFQLGKCSILFQYRHVYFVRTRYKTNIPWIMSDIFFLTLVERNISSIVFFILLIFSFNLFIHVLNFVLDILLLMIYERTSSQHHSVSGAIVISESFYEHFKFKWCTFICRTRFFADTTFILSSVDKWFKIQATIWQINIVPKTPINYAIMIWND